MKVARPINKSTDIMVQHSIPSNRHVQHITSTLASKDVTGKWGDREREETKRFLHCDVARVVWSFFYGLFGVEWVMPCVLWGLWRERNSRLFEDVEVQAGALCRNMLNMFFFGCRRKAWVVCRTLIFYFLVRFGPLIKGSFVYSLCTRVAPLCAF
jgi:hypothetical protein